MRVDEIVKWVKGPKVLDVGCTGHDVEIDSPYWLYGCLHRKFPGVVGIDICSDYVSILREKGFTEVYVQNAEEFNLSEKFDTIVAGELIEHLSNPGMFLLRSKEHLSKNGRIVLTTPYPFSLLYALFAVLKFPGTCSNLEHTCWFCPQTLKTLAERHGLKIIYFDIIEDYRPENQSYQYRSLVRFIEWFRPVIPKRFRSNTMLFVLTIDDDSGTL